jgi:hypothetical protein
MKTQYDMYASCRFIRHGMLNMAINKNAENKFKIIWVLYPQKKALKIKIILYTHTKQCDADSNQEFLGYPHKCMILNESYN